jgi:hypothetical protein
MQVKGLKPGDFDGPLLSGDYTRMSAKDIALHMSGPGAKFGIFSHFATDVFGGKRRVYLFYSMQYKQWCIGPVPGGAPFYMVYQSNKWRVKKGDHYAEVAGVKVDCAKTPKPRTPTARPTRAPTLRPTDRPTDAETASPTAAPTVTPRTRGYYSHRRRRRSSSSSTRSRFDDGDSAQAEALADSVVQSAQFQDGTQV